MKAVLIVLAVSLSQALPDLPIEKLAVGQKGDIAYKEFDGTKAQTLTAAVKIAQIQDESTVVVQSVAPEGFAFFIKTPSQGLVDGKVCYLSAMEVVGTDKTKSGRTLFVLKPLKPIKWQ